MNDCLNVEAREALPDYLNGRLSALDQATMKAHVESCADCRAELDLLREIRDRGPIVPRMDVDRISAALPSYAAPTARRTGYARRLAAAVGLVAVGGLVLTSRDRQLAPTAAQTASVPGVSVTAVAEAPLTQATIDATSNEVQVAALSLVGGTSDLSDDDLAQLVQHLEGIEALPAAEPSSITLSVDDIESDNDQ